MKYNHKEAFCLMQYKDRVTGETEILWNSRDGVTPFGITSRRGNESFHENWNQDICVPDFKPAPGMRFFVNATKENMLPKLREYVDKYWDKGDYPMSKVFPTKEDAIEKLLPEWIGDGNQPTVMEMV